MSIEREEFEQAVTDRWSDSYSFTRFGDEDYYDEVLEGMWRGWQASRQALDGEPVAWWDGDMSAAEDSFSFKSNRCYTIPLYTHPASAQKEIERLQARVAELCDLIKYAQVKSGACMCGDNMQDHNQSSGHSPVDVWDHAVEQVDKGGTSEALILRKQAEAVQASRQAASVPDAWCVVTNDDQIQYTSMVDKNLGLPIEQSHDYAWQQCNEVIQEWIELGLDAASKYVIRPIALLATPTKADDWMPSGFRRPQPPKQEGE
jgi:hypothetical protein